MNSLQKRQRKLSEYAVANIRAYTCIGGKISNKYRFKIIIKCKNNSEFRALLSKILCEFGKNKEFSGVTAYADMNALVC